MTSRPATSSTATARRLVHHGQVLTQTGRLIPAPPAIRTDSARKCERDLRRSAEWLVEQARAEAVAAGDRFQQRQFSAMRPANLSPSDYDWANLYLFGDTYPVFYLPAEGLMGSAAELQQQQQSNAGNAGNSGW